MTERTACAACRFHHRRCPPDCIFRPYFPPEKPKDFINVQDLFRTNKIKQILQKAHEQGLQDGAAQAIKFESYVRKKFPVHGCNQVIWDLVFDSGERTQSSEKMASGGLVSRLHLLIDRCVRRYVEGKVNLSTEEIEKDLLLSLSHVMREIQSWISEICLDSGAETAAAPGSKDHLCLERLVADLVGLLGVKNVHVQHLAGNILVEVSESLVEYGSQWEDFIRFLCDCLHLAVIYSCPIPSVSSPNLFEGSIIHYIGSDVLKGEMEKANWCTVSDIFRVLRNILKRLRQEENEELIDVYLESVNSTLAKIPWCRVNTHFSNRLGSGKRNSQGHNGTLGSTAISDEGTIFLGNFVQFLCSLVQQVRFAENSDAFGPTHLILQKTI